jgi:hypothetical protein
MDGSGQPVELTPSWLVARLLSRHPAWRRAIITSDSITVLRDYSQQVLPITELSALRASYFPIGEVCLTGRDGIELRLDCLSPFAARAAVVSIARATASRLSALAERLVRDRDGERYVATRRCISS